MGKKINKEKCYYEKLEVVCKDGVECGSVRWFHSGLAATASGATNGSKVWQQYFDNREAEKWDIQQLRSTYKIASKPYGKVFDIEFNSTGDGGNVNLWASLSGVNSQLWSIVQL